MGDLSVDLLLQEQLEDTGMVPHVSSCHLCKAIALVFPRRGLLWGHTPPVAPGQRSTYGHNGWLTIALQNERVLAPHRVPLGL